MAKMHFVMQGKGGVGKSLSALILAQYLARDGQKVLCLDTDPVNRSFSQFTNLNVQAIELMNGEVLEAHRFDELMNLLLASTTDAVIDNGAASFLPLSHYLTSNEAWTALSESGHEMIVHTIIVGGSSLMDTLGGFGYLADQFPESVKIVMWLNPYFGELTYEGKALEDAKLYRKHQHRLAGLVNLPALPRETFGRDLSTMLQGKQTFDDALADKTWGVMSRQRLKVAQRQFFERLDMAKVV